MDFLIGVLYILINATLSEKTNCCPKGWINNEESCYYVIRNQLDFRTAEHYCISKHSLLVEIDTIDEWNLIRQLPPTDRYFWIGIRDSNNNNNNIISARGSILNIEQLQNLPWLVKKKDIIQKRDNGWSLLNNCAAYLNTINVDAGYVYFHNCNLNFYAICERNVTRLGFD
uniref:C-type lectin domain-containing protein n=1 Tax=Parastrongyloides trichosuri TaxID=131310 RepID=A0A0N4ZRR1_PARTI